MDGVRWLEAEDHFELGYWVLFARGLDPELLRRLGAAPEPAELTRVQASDLEEPSGGAVMRVGSSGGRAFGVAEYGSLSQEAVAAVSAGTAAVELSRTVNHDTGFAYAEDGRTVCGFEPGMQRHRTGQSPTACCLPCAPRASCCRTGATRTCPTRSGGRSPWPRRSSASACPGTRSPTAR